MKFHSIFSWFKLLFFIVMVSSCAQLTESTTTLPPVLPTIPASTATPTRLSTVTDTPTPASTAIATLPAEEASKRLLELLASNGGCRLPCLWGITPGKSTYQEAQVILAPLSSISSSENFTPDEGGSISPKYTETDMNLFTTVDFNVDSLYDNQIVSRVGLLARDFKIGKPGDDAALSTVFDSKIFGDYIAYYSLQNELSEQGIPSSVMIATSGVPVPQGGSGGFDILLLYPDQGILVNYTMQGFLFGSVMRGCPMNAHVELNLYTRGNSDSFFEQLKQTDWEVRMDYYKPLEEVTSMSLEEFYETFRQSTDKCVETSAKLWPTPVP